PSARASARARPPARRGPARAISRGVDMALAAGMIGVILNGTTVDAKPPITLSSLDYDRPAAGPDSLPDNSLPAKGSLRAELDRADIVEPNEIPPSVVTMNSTVRFALHGSSETFSLTLVYPKDADGKADCISVLAPVGSALLGLSAGDDIEWPGPGGAQIRVRIVEVVYQPERAGEFHR